MAGPDSRKVILFLPSYDGKIFGPPLGLLSLAGSVRDAGYNPVIVDGALSRDYRHIINKNLAGCLCFGVSLLTGPMISDAIEIASLVRNLRPEVPIVFGGWHPSLLSGQTLREDFVDIVVRHHGEKTLVEILQRLESGGGLERVDGCWFKRNGQIIQNADRHTIPLYALPPPAYDLIDFDAYERAIGERKLPFATSIGCPYACSYCTDAVFYNRRFNPYHAEQVVQELAELAGRHRITEVSLVDSNFLVDVRRALAIARGIIESGVRFRWTFQASTDLLCRMTDEEVELLAASGVSHIGFGTESASSEVLQFMNKGHQHIPDMYEAARKCGRAGIRVTFNLIFGFPGEEDRHRRETLRVMSDIADKFENVSFSPNIFTPYPGIPVWPQLRKMGLRDPESLKAWADFALGSNHLPWLHGNVFETLQRSISYFLLDAQISRAQRRCQSRALGKLLRFARKPVHWRLKHSFFDWPLELWLSMVKRWLVVRRSLLTGQPLGHQLGGAR